MPCEGELQAEGEAGAWGQTLHAGMSHQLVFLSVHIPSVLPAHPKAAGTFVTWTSNGFTITPPRVLSASVLD